MEDGHVTDDCPLYEGKGSKSYCTNYTGISFLSRAGKVYLTFHMPYANFIGRLPLQLSTIKLIPCSSAHSGCWSAQPIGLHNYHIQAGLVHFANTFFFYI